MKTLLSFFFTTLLAGTALAQHERLDSVTDSITKEATALYRSESASWYGTDIFTEKCKDKMPKVGGYLSYDNGKSINSIFFSNDSKPVVMGTISFPYDNITMAAGTLDTVVRNFTKGEKDLYEMRKTVLDMIQTNKDKLFKFYNNIGVNPVPVNSNGQKKVYVLAGPKESGIVVFGNDYLITFDDNNNVLSARSLHKNIIIASYGQNQDKDKIAIGSMHTHLPSSGDFISATDVCTLMLYGKFTTWKTYSVISANNVSVWNCTQNKLVILTKEAWDKVNAQDKILPKQ